jgi:hypothetical protein
MSELQVFTYVALLAIMENVEKRCHIWDTTYILQKNKHFIMNTFDYINVMVCKKMCAI